MKGLGALLVAACLVAGACGGSGSGAVASPSTRAASPSPPISTEWVEYHRDAGRSGQGPAEPALTNPSMAWKVAVDGEVYASPLIVGGHVIVATENDTVYSLDLFTGSTLWKTHLGSPVDASSLPCGDIGPVTGITGTPAADPASGRVYAVAFLAGHHHMLFGLNLIDGSIASQQDVDPSGSDPGVEQERGALAIANGYVYVPLGGLYGDCGPYHGYVVAVPLVGGAAFAYRVPAARAAGIWSSQGVTVAGSGDLFVTTGNAAVASDFAYSNSVVSLSPVLHVNSFFAPANWKALDSGDVDLGSVGATLLPALGVVVVVGKDGMAYVLREAGLGGIGGQAASHRVCAGAWGGTAWSGSTVYVPCRDALVALTITPSSVSVLWSSTRAHEASPILAAGALWAIDTSSATLYALNPSDGSVIYSTALGQSMHFATPAATEGFVVAPAGTNVEAVLTLGPS